MAVSNKRCHIWAWDEQLLAREEGPIGRLRWPIDHCLDTERPSRQTPVRRFDFKLKLELQTLRRSSDTYSRPRFSELSASQSLSLVGLQPR